MTKTGTSPVRSFDRGRSVQRVCVQLIMGHIHNYRARAREYMLLSYSTHIPSCSSQSDFLLHLVIWWVCDRRFCHSSTRQLSFLKCHLLLKVAKLGLPVVSLCHPSPLSLQAPSPSLPVVSLCHPSPLSLQAPSPSLPMVSLCPTLEGNTPWASWITSECASPARCHALMATP